MPPHSIVGIILWATSGGLSFYFSNDNKHDTATTAEKSKYIIELLQNIISLFAYMSTIWENTDACLEKYRCATALYLLSMLART